MKRKEELKVQSIVVKGYTSEHGNTPTQKEIDGLSVSQINHYKEIGERIRHKKYRRNILIIILALVILVLISILYLYPLIKYSIRSNEIKNNVVANYSNNKAFNDCYQSYISGKDFYVNPGEYYETISRGYYYCIEKTNPKAELAPTTAPSPEANPKPAQPSSPPVQQQQPTTSKPLFRVTGQYSPSSAKVGQQVSFWVEANLPIAACEFTVSGPDGNFIFAEGTGNRCTSRPIMFLKPGTYTVDVLLKEVVVSGERQTARAFMGPISVTE